MAHPIGSCLCRRRRRRLSEQRLATIHCPVLHCLVDFPVTATAVVATMVEAAGQAVGEQRSDHQADLSPKQVEVELS